MHFPLPYLSLIDSYHFSLVKMGLYSGIVFLAILNILYLRVRAFHDPCQSNGNIGDSCDYNSDCKGSGVVCKSGQCDCHEFYQLKNDTDGRKYCVKSPDVINATCSGNCRFPMFCNGGQCQCIRAKREGNQCHVTSNLGDSCTGHYECTLPFSACLNGKCACVTGTTASNGACVAEQHCPDGGKSRGACVRLTKDASTIQNRFNNTDTDTCPGGFYCYSSDVSLSGHCCPQLCPFSGEPDLSYSCTPGASSPCPSDTHFCHRFSGQSFSVGVCCHRPCKEPTPVFINGKCYGRAWLGAPCSISEQCQAGIGMQCSNGVCVCAQGYKPETGSFVSSQNPPQQCVKDCGASIHSRAGDCFPNVGLGQQCDVDDQCPSQSKCYRGTCICNCEQGYVKNGEYCIKPSTTTAKPGTGTTPGGLLGLVNGLLKGRGGGLPSLGR